jgi:hypothetical protein
VVPPAPVEAPPRLLLVPAALPPLAWSPPPAPAAPPPCPDELQAVAPAAATTAMAAKHARELRSVLDLKRERFWLSTMCER